MSIGRVYFLVGDKVVHASDDPNEWFLTTAQIENLRKNNDVRVVVFDSKNRFVTEQTIRCTPQKPVSES